METEDRKLSPEVEEKLNKLRGYSPKFVFYFVPDIYKENLPKKDWPVFKCQTMDGEDAVVSEDSMKINVYGDGTAANLAELRIIMLRRNLRGFKNYKNKKGVLIECKYDNKEKEIISYDSLYSISVDMQILIIQAIKEEQKLTDQEKEGLEF